MEHFHYIILYIYVYNGNKYRNWRNGCTECYHAKLNLEWVELRLDVYVWVNKIDDEPLKCTMKFINYFLKRL